MEASHLKASRGRPRCFDREKALAQAMEIFWRQGYEATSLTDLTAAMGINPPSLYAAFGSKEGLFLAAVERYQTEILTAFGKIIEEAPTAREAIAGVLDRWARTYPGTSHPSGCMIVTSTMNCSEKSTHLQTRLAEKRRTAEAGLKARIERGIQDGDVPPGTDAGALAGFYATVIQGMSIQARDGATLEKLRATGEAAMRVWPV